MNRIAILVVVGDKDSVDEYVIYMIRELKRYASKIVVTINGTIQQHEIDKISINVDEVYCRENKGYDCGAYKDTLEQYLGWDEIEKYDELLLINDSCFGPIYSLDDLFGTMGKRDLDFWGITEQTPIKKYKFSTKLLPYHIQSYFMNINFKMLHSKDFKEYWKNVNPANDYDNAVANFELTFTKFFNDRGYKSGAYIDCKEFCPSEEENLAYIFMNSYRLVSEHKCPFLKKKVFTYPQDIVLSANSGETARKTLDFITYQTEYDEKLIWKCLISNVELRQLKVNLHLDFFAKNVLDERCATDDTWILMLLKEPYLNNDVIEFIRLATTRKCLLIGTRDLLNEYKGILGDELHCCEYNNANSIKKVEQIISGSKAIYFVNESSMIKTCMKELVCYDVAKLFEENPYIGFFNVPMNYEEKYFLEHFEDSSDSNHLIIRTELLLKAFESSSYIQVLYKLYEQDFLCCGELKKEYEIIAKRNGYCYGEVSTYEQARYMINDYHFMLKSYVGKYIIPMGIEELKNVRKINVDLIEFCKNNEKIYIYGAGEIARECFRYLIYQAILADAFIVSDGMRENTEIQSLKIYELSELKIDVNDGVIIATAPVFIKEIEKVLQSRKIKNYITYEQI